jgi:hypothetical protein
MADVAKLLIVDIDGTLVRRDGAIDARDREAVREAAGAGIVVALATGRLTIAARAVARELGVRAPLICADGSVIACGDCGQAIQRHALQASFVTFSIERFARANVAAFPFLADAIRYDVSDRQYLPYLGVWAEGSVPGPSGSLPPANDDLVALLGVGRKNDVESLVPSLAGVCDDVDVGVFELSTDRAWALRLQPRGANKGSAVAALQSLLGLERAEVAAVGDWYNDVSLFARAHRSFAMAHAPEVVRQAATEVLEASADTGGGVAEAIARWL